MKNLPVFICLTLKLVVFLSADDAGESMYCEYYNKTSCEGEFREDCVMKERCRDTRDHCYVLWHYNNETMQTTVKLKGCFGTNKDCYDRENCVEERHLRDNQHLFCCCDGNMCNTNFSWDPKPTESTTVDISARHVKSPQHQIFTVIFISIIITTLVLLLVAFYHRKLLEFTFVRKTLGYFQDYPEIEMGRRSPSPEPRQVLGNVELLQVKARGRFGQVWKARLNGETVAVKVFQNKESWQAEQKIFELPQMDHEDVLRFIGAEKCDDMEFWIVTAYHERGSLHDYLKANIVTWEEVCRISESMARGLMHLHEELPRDKVHGKKPAVAHRDFKSKNVLLKDDLSACIADFGLAIVFNPGEKCGDTHGQVGTLRYMAPEVLEGAIHFTRDAFLRIDMYAFALVLWELASRCTVPDGIVSQYKLPFEAEVGEHPSLETMQDTVVHKKERPLIPDTWRKHEGLRVICDTMEECWDHDAESRLMASCVNERISLLHRRILYGSSTDVLDAGAPDEPLLCNDKDTSL